MQSLHFILLTVFLITLGAEAQKKQTAPAQKPAVSKDEIAVNGLKFRNIGPALTSGRIADFAVNPKNPFEYFVATASGGVWKTTNGGTTYEPVFDSQGSYSIGCITMDPENPNVIWVGSGENNNQRSVAYGDGVYKSEDGGATWKNTGLKTSEHIGRIVIDPTDPSTVYVAAIGPLWSEGGERGVYKTTDGGKTWNQVLKIDEHTGVNDLVMDPRNPKVLYAAAFQRRRHDYAYISGGPGSGMYKTTDGGKSWDKINSGLPAGDKGRIGLAISPANPEYVYAIVEASPSEAGFYRSVNRGASWQKMSSHQTGGNYYNEVVADPVNPDRVYTMGYDVSISTDGGKNFRPIGEKSKHVDNHALWVNPANTNHMINGCDGGIYETKDGAKTWEYKSNLPVTQFYKVEVDQSEPFYFVYGGTQDNFSLGGPSRTRNENGIVNSDWFVTNGGDGFESAIDPDNPNIVYAQSQYGGLVRFDKITGESVGIQPKPGKGENEYRWNWDAPLFTSPHKKGRIYFAANKVFRSDDYGSTWTAISDDVTRALDRNKLPVMGKVWGMDAIGKNDGTAQFGTVSALAESPLNEKMIAVGTDDGLIQITVDGGANWKKYSTFPGIPDMTYVYHLVYSQHEVNTLYATFNNHKRGDFKPYLLKSIDNGATWTSVTADLPERGSTYVLLEDFKEPDLLFTGTEFGAYYSIDRGRSWRQFKTGLPVIAIRDMAIQKRENDLVLASFGRGFFVLDDYSPLRHLTKTAGKPAGLFPVKDSWLYLENSPLGIRGKGFMGESYYQAENPKVGAVFTWFSNEEFKSKKDQRIDSEKKAAKDGKDVFYPTEETLKAEQSEEADYYLFTIKNQKGETVRKLKADVKKGVQRITWDFRVPTTSPVNINPAVNDNVFSSFDVGHLVSPGTYSVILSRYSNGKLTDIGNPEKFNVKALPGLSLPAADAGAVAAWKAEVYEMRRVASGAGALLNDANNRVKHMRAAIMSISKANDDFTTDLNSLDKKLRELSERFYGDNVKGRLELDAPPSIFGRLNNALYDGYGSTGEPTTTMKSQFKNAGDQFEGWYSELKTILNTDLKNLEMKLEAAGAPYTPGRIPEWRKN
jgi:photosystem II stability/assembly factor-like uncharacterized protein